MKLSRLGRYLSPHAARCCPNNNVFNSLIQRMNNYNIVPKPCIKGYQFKALLVQKSSRVLMSAAIDFDFEIYERATKLK